MRGNRLRPAVYALAGTLAVLAVAGYTFADLQTYRAAGRELSILQAKAQQLWETIVEKDALEARRALLAEELFRARNRAARLGTFDPLKFSQDVKAVIEAHGVSVDTFRTADAEERIEVLCSFRGEGSQVFAFLKTVAEQREHWIVPEVAIVRTGEGDTVIAELRITHEKIAGTGR